MANRSSSRGRDRRAARDDAARRAAQRADRRRTAIAVFAVTVVVLAIVGTMLAAANDKGTSSSASTTTSSVDPLADLSSTTTSVATGPTVSVTPAPAGAAISGPTPCPAEDGSSPRTTMFAAPPPTCIDTTKTYDAVISTSEGDLKMYLNTSLAPTAVNNFIVLARYHYYDGAPFSTIVPQTTAQVGSDVTGAGGATSPGYTLPGEYPKGGTIFPTGTLLMVKVPGQGDHFGGAFQIALGNKAADLPADTTAFGLMLDGTDTLNRIDKSGTPDGSPTKVITIDHITVELAPVTTTTSGG